jgi:hypothetical protein
MADSHDFAVRLQDLHTMAEYLRNDSENLADANSEYTNAIPDQSEAMLGPGFADTLYSQFDADYGTMSSSFFNVLTDLGNNLELSSQALLEIERRYREADEQAASSFTSIHTELMAR